MRVLTVRRISDRLRAADFRVESVRSIDTTPVRNLIVISEPADRDELARVLDALAVGYEVEMNEAEPGVEVVLKETD